MVSVYLQSMREEFVCKYFRSSERTPCLLKGFGMKRKRLSGESGTPYFSIITLSGLEKRRVSYPY